MTLGMSLCGPLQCEAQTRFLPCIVPCSSAPSFPLPRGTLQARPHTTGHDACSGFPMQALQRGPRSCLATDSSGSLEKLLVIAHVTCQEKDLPGTGFPSPCNPAGRDSYSFPFLSLPSLPLSSHPLKVTFLGIQYKV